MDFEMPEKTKLIIGMIDEFVDKNLFRLSRNY